MPGIVGSVFLAGFDGVTVDGRSAPNTNVVVAPAAVVVVLGDFAVPANAMLSLADSFVETRLTSLL